MNIITTLSELVADGRIVVPTILVNVWTRIKPRIVDCDHSFSAQVKYVQNGVPADVEGVALLLDPPITLLR
jgi:hypothetical protein